MPRHANPVKLLLAKECEKRGLSIGGSIETLAIRLKKDEDRKSNNNRAKNRSKYESKIGTRDHPLKIKAQKYVDTFCNGDINQSSPQWVQKSPSSRVKLMVAHKSNSKSGKIIRWVCFKGHNKD